MMSKRQRMAKVWRRSVGSVFAGAVGGVLILGSAGLSARAWNDVADVPSEERLVKGDENRFYFLIGAGKEDEKVKAPKEGFGLLLVLPGGNGGKGFHTFVKRIYKNSLSKDYLVAELVAPQWSERQSASLVWPTKKKPWPKMKFSTEEFVESVIEDVKADYEIRPDRIFTLGWSSGGPPSYAIALQDRTAVTGAYIAQSVFHRGALPSLKKARGRAFFLDHSPEDKVCPYPQAQQAEKVLKKVGAKVKLVTYDGGHGWKGRVYDRISTGIRFLEKNHRKVRRVR